MALISSLIVVVIAFIVMGAAGALIADVIAILAVFVSLLGTILMLPRKPASK
jgi:hypothetical protein